MKLKLQPTAWKRGGFITQDKHVADHWAKAGDPLTPLFEAEDDEEKSLGDILNPLIEKAATQQEARLQALNECLAIVKAERDSDFPDIRTIRDQIVGLIDAMGGKDAQE